MTDDSLPPLLLTPGPLTTAPEVRMAMLKDWGSRDPDFMALTEELRSRLLAVAHGEQTHCAVPIQGSGTYVLEAAVGSLMEPADKLLVLVNGAYGERMIQIATRLGRRVEALRWPENRLIDAQAVRNALAEDPSITHVAMVHCETTTGLLNPLADVAAAVADAGPQLLVDAMSSFGALPIDLRSLRIGAVLASSNKCLEGPPGLAFGVIETQWLARCGGYSPSVSLDLHAQWRGFEETRQWRFTPPVQVVAALVEALRLLEAEGGPAARLKRYQGNLDILLQGASRLGLKLYLDLAVQAPIIATFHMPTDNGFVFANFYDALASLGFVIYPGKLTQAPSFRIGCIGDVDGQDFKRLVTALGLALQDTENTF